MDYEWEAEAAGTWEPWSHHKSWSAQGLSIGWIKLLNHYHHGFFLKRKLFSKPNPIIIMPLIDTWFFLACIHVDHHHGFLFSHWAISNFSCDGLSVLLIQAASILHSWVWIICARLPSCCCCSAGVSSPLPRGAPWESPVCVGGNLHLSLHDPEDTHER